MEPRPLPAAVALDYDGTLARAGRLADGTGEALRDARAAGLRLVLVTGRRVADLLRICPEAGALFDRVVAEDGAVLAGPRGSRALVRPLPRALPAELLRRSVPLERGEIVLATKSVFEGLVEAAIAEHAPSARLSRNRDSLMVLPAGADKANGLRAALAELGLVPASCVAVGDGENDVPLFGAAGAGYAVADAVPALKAAAREVLPLPNGEGVRWLLGRLVTDRASPGRR